MLVDYVQVVAPIMAAIVPVVVFLLKYLKIAFHTCYIVIELANVWLNRMKALCSSVKITAVIIHCLFSRARTTFPLWQH